MADLEVEAGRDTPDPDRAPAGSCRFCEAPLEHTFVDLGMSPLANRYLSATQLNEMEPFFPLRAYVCERCFLVQLAEYQAPAAIFTEYAYFASYSDAWVAHARSYVGMATERFGLSSASQVVEIASNDGYLLQHFVAKGIPVLGIEPAANVAREAIARGIPTKVEFFGRESAARLASAGVAADLVVANNVLAHVPALNDFVAGIALVLGPEGVVTLEFPHLLTLMDHSEFDTIYHEHFSYFSLLTVEQVFTRHGLPIFDVEELPTHGGSLRIYARHGGRTTQATTDEQISERMRAVRARETAAGLSRLDSYSCFDARAREAKRSLLEFLIATKRAGKSVVAYGAPAKGNTLLNYCGVRSDFIEYTVDRSPHKQGRFLPGTHLPIHHPDRIRETRPDYLLILPWNLTDEITRQMAHIRAWGGRFVVPIPRATVLP
jgi:SAM-dependent methyltransferase